MSLPEEKILNITKCCHMIRLLLQQLTYLLCLALWTPQLQLFYQPECTAEAQEHSPGTLSTWSPWAGRGQNDFSYWISQLRRAKPIPSWAGTSVWESLDTDREQGHLELKAMFLALQIFAAQERDQHILLLVGNMTAIAYPNRQGGYKYYSCGLCISMMLVRSGIISVC